MILAEPGLLLAGPRLAAAKAARESGYEVCLAAALDRGFSREADLRAAIDAAGLSFWDMPALGSRAGFFKELAQIGVFGELLDALRPDIVHCIGLRPVIFGGAAARLRGLPAVLAVPGCAARQGAHGAKGALRRFMIRSGLAIAAGHAKAALVLQSPDDRMRALSIRTLHSRRAFLIRGAATDLSVFYPRGPAERRPSPPAVLFASSALGSADVQCFAAAAALVHAKGLDARFVVMGEQDPSQAGAASQEELRSYEQAGLIEWRGQPEDGAAALRQADLFCYPGSSAGAIPGILVEALASGLPIVAGDGPYARLAVRHGSNGMLVPPRDAQALASALERIIMDGEFRRVAGERSREIAEAEYSLEAFLTASLTVYRAVLGDSPACHATIHRIERGRAP